MELWEFNACVNAYNQKCVDKQKEITIQSWQTANFMGAVWKGKLNDLSFYIDDKQTVKAPSVDKDIFDRMCENAKRKEVNVCH